MLSNEDHVGALAGQWQLVLKEHLNVGQAGGYEISMQRRDAAFPRPVLTRRWFTSGPNRHLLSNKVGKMMLDGRKAAD
jgi:hypothetical protein